MTRHGSSTPGSSRAWLVLGLVAVGLALRIGLAIYRGLSSEPELGSDQQEYDVYAWNLAQGNGYRGLSPDVADQNHLTAYRPPGPSLVWAGVYQLTGRRYDAIRILHCFLGAASIWLTWRIGRGVLGWAVGLVAAGLYAIYPLAIYQSTELLSEPLGVFLFLLFIDRTLVFAQLRTWGGAIQAGIVLGLSLLTRANYVLMLPLIMIWGGLQFRSSGLSLLKTGTIFLTAALVMTPWVVRNHQVFGRFIPFSTTGGSALLQGNNRIVVTKPELYGYSVWDTEIPEYAAALREPNDEVERDRRAKEFAIQWLKDNPDKWGFLAWHKFIRSWSPWLEHNPSRAHRLIYLVTWGPILVLFAIGFFPTLIRSLRAGDPTWLLHLAVLHYVLNSVIFFANIRYRSPVDPVCIIIASWTAVRLFERLRGRRFDNG